MRTQSNTWANGSGRAASVRRTAIRDAPAARTIPASSSTRFGRTSAATTSPRSPTPALMAVALPPGAAHASSTRSPGRGAATTATSCDASSWTANNPSPASGVRSGLPLTTMSPSGANRVAVVSTPAARSRSASASRVIRSRLARSVNGAASLSNRHQASAAAKPCRSSQRATSHAGCERVVEKYAISASRVPGTRAGSGSRSRSRPTRRSTAFTSGAALAFPARRARLTASFTAAEAGTRSRCSNWKMERRRMSATSGSRRSSGRFVYTAIRWSKAPCHRSVPAAISPASARSRSSGSPLRTWASAAGRSTRRAPTARSTSNAATRAGAIMRRSARSLLATHGPPAAPSPSSPVFLPAGI